jgi:hypothetical protein
LEDFTISLAVAFGPNGITGDQKRRETEDHKTPKSEHLPTRTIGFVWSLVAVAFPVDVHISKFILLSRPSYVWLLPT